MSSHDKLLQLLEYATQEQEFTVRSEDITNTQSEDCIPWKDLIYNYIPHLQSCFDKDERLYTRCKTGIVEFLSEKSNKRIYDSKDPNSLCVPKEIQSEFKEWFSTNFEMGFIDYEFPSSLSSCIDTFNPSNPTNSSMMMNNQQESKKPRKKRAPSLKPSSKIPMNVVGKIVLCVNDIIY